MFLEEAENPTQDLPEGTQVQEPPPPLEQGLGPDEQQEIEFDALKKYILFTKIRELKDKIEGAQVVITDDYKRVLYFLNIVLTFYDVFDYLQLTNIIDQVITLQSQMKLKE